MTGSRAPAAGELPRRSRCASARAAAALPPSTRRRCWVAGICLIRLGGLRPRLLPAAVRLTTENAAHRIAVEGQPTARSRLSTSATGHRLPAHRAAGRAGLSGVHSGHASPWPRATTICRSPCAARMATWKSTSTSPWNRNFRQRSVRRCDRGIPLLEQGAVGCRRPSAGEVEGVRLDTTAWRVDPDASCVRSSYFSDAAVFRRAAPARLRPGDAPRSVAGRRCPHSLSADPPGTFDRSAAIVVSSPWPVRTTVSPGSVSSRVRIDVDDRRVVAVGAAGRARAAAEQRVAGEHRRRGRRRRGRCCPASGPGVARRPASSRRRRSGVPSVSSSSGRGARVDDVPEHAVGRVEPDRRAGGLAQRRPRR